jgi:hypothetical protein
MKHALLVLLLLLVADSALAACKEKRSRDPSFIELSVPEDAIRPSGPDDFRFVTDDTTIEQLFARVGPPDASSGSGIYNFVWCFADGTELKVSSRDRVAIDQVRHEGKLLFKRSRKK